MGANVHFNNLFSAVHFLYNKGYRTEYYLKNKGLWNSTTGVSYPFGSISILMTVVITSYGESELVKCIHAFRLQDGSVGVYIDLTGNSILEE